MNYKQSCEPYAFIFSEICMHICTKKGSKYAAICNYMLEYARICIYFKAILENNCTKFNNRISRKTKNDNLIQKFSIYNINNNQQITLSNFFFSKNGIFFENITFFIFLRCSLFRVFFVF